MLQVHNKLTSNAKIKGMNNFPLWFGFGPSINFLSTKIPLLPLETTSIIVFTMLGIQAVPLGRICNSKGNPIHRLVQDKYIYKIK